MPARRPRNACRPPRVSWLTRPRGLAAGVDRDERGSADTGGEFARVVDGPRPGVRQGDADAACSTLRFA